MKMRRAGRRGITVLEVLIAIGILSIGLASVVALVPAGQSQASRAIVIDRAAVLAANTLADAATFGVLRPAAVTNGSSRPLTIDSAGTSLAGAAAGGLRTQGIFSSSGSAAPVAYHNLFLQSRDDIVLGPPNATDNPPTNAFLDGARSYEGRMSSLLCLQSGTPGGPDLLSVIVFHRRDPAFTTLTGTLASGTLTIPTTQATPLGTRLVTDVIKPGVVVFTNVSGPRFHQVTSARLDTISALNGTTPGVYTAWMTFSTGMTITTSTTSVTLQFLPDSVGLAERPFVPETTGAYTQ